MVLFHSRKTPVPSTTDMAPAILSRITIDEDLIELSNRVLRAEVIDCLELNYLINAALGLPQTATPMSSLDATLQALRAHFPQPEWRYGFQDGGFKGYTGPTAWLSNGRCQITGFDNHYDYEYRYYERSGRTIEAAFVALVLKALAHKG